MKNLLKSDWARDIIMGIQYLFVAAGATILVPILTGIPASVCLFTAGMGTLLFHLITKGKLPVLLSSSFAFIAPIVAVTELYGQQYAFGGMVIAGLAYLLFSLIIYFVGLEKVTALFPPAVSSTMVILIGLILAPVAIYNASVNWPIAFFTLFAGLLVKAKFDKSMFGSLSILTAIIVGTIVSSLFGFVDTSGVAQASFFGMPDFALPLFSASSILIIAPVAIVTFLEHFADISAVGKIVGKDYLKDPGVHRTLIGDGVATGIAGLLGGCPNTTYSENIGALELTGVKKPRTLQITAVLLILLSFFPKLTQAIHTIPAPVIGGISILLFGMIASSGIKSLVSDKVDFSGYKNMVIVSTMLVIGVGGAIIEILGVQFSSLAVAAVVGVLLNFLLTKKIK